MAKKRNREPTSKLPKTTIRLILARLEGTEADETVLRYAHQVAVRHGSHIRALHVRRAQLDMPLLAPDTTVSAVAAAKGRFDRWHEQLKLRASTPAEGPSAEFLERAGDQVEALVAHGALADLIVLARPMPEFAPLSRLALEGALFETGRPVLIVPPSVLVDMFINPIIAWNGTCQASRALGMSLPIIKECSGPASILTVPEQNREASAVDVVEYLRWHDVEAEVARPDSSEVGTQLLELAHWRDSGLIVSGAYARSRFRHVLFGGVTSYLIHHSNIPLLMAH